MGFGVVVAGHKGVEAFDAVDQAHLLKEAQRPIDGRRLGRAFGVKAVDQVIGLYGAIVRQNQLKGAQAWRGHALTSGEAQGLRLGKTRLNAVAVKGMVVMMIVIAGGVSHASNVVGTGAKCNRKGFFRLDSDYVIT